jgi:type III secretion protein D
MWKWGLGEMTLELRILNGLHRGASLPVEPGVELVLGSDSGCDVVLVDQGMPEIALRLGVEPEAWLAYATDAQGQPVADEPARLALGLAFELHGIRVCVCKPEQPWAFDLAPVAPPIDHDAAPRLAGLHAELPDAAEERGAEHPSFGAGIDAAPDEPAVATAAASTPPKAKLSLASWDWWRRRAWLAVPATVVLGMVTFRAASMVHPDPAARAPAAAASMALPGASAASAAASPEELRRLFKARLQAAELLRALEVELTDSHWVLRGDLGPEEDARLERLVAAFFAQHRPNVTFEATIVPSVELLPFRIAQISAGRLAHVVTADGKRLFVGDQLKGYTLARVEPTKVVFTGKRRIEVAL